MSDDKVELFSSSGGLAILLRTDEGIEAHDTYDRICNMLHASVSLVSPLEVKPKVLRSELSVERWIEVLHELFQCVKKTVAILERDGGFSPFCAVGFICEKLDGLETLIYLCESLYGFDVVTPIKRDFNRFISGSYIAV